jgi:hypothetical protein
MGVRLAASRRHLIRGDLADGFEGGDTLDQFQYPSVTRELAIAALEEARLSLVSQLR